MVTATSSGIMINSGLLLENIVFIALRHVTSQIFYYKTSTNLEVDFIAQMADRSRILIQVCESLVEPKTKQREIRSNERAQIKERLDCDAK